MSNACERVWLSAARIRCAALKGRLILNSFGMLKRYPDTKQRILIILGWRERKFELTALWGCAIGGIGVVVVSIRRAVKRSRARL